MDRRECTIFPPTIPWAGFPANREKEADFALIVPRVRSEPHSTAKDLPGIVNEYPENPRKGLNYRSAPDWAKEGV